MIPINVDISPIIEEFVVLSNRSEEFASYVLDRMVEDFMFNWNDMVGKELHGTRKEYLSAMDVNRTAYNEAIISLLPTKSNLPLKIEDGASSFDMREGFSKSEKRTDKDDGGWYLTIPFKFATSEAIAESMVFSQKMPKPIEKIAKENNGDPISMSQLPDQYKKLLANKTTGVKHKSPIYEGIKRLQTSATEKENRGGYISFRRVSDNSEDGSWTHPGFVGKKFMDRAANQLEQNMTSIIDQATNDFILET